jgi:hypothetical protein
VSPSPPAKDPGAALEAARPSAPRAVRAGEIPSFEAVEGLLRDLGPRLRRGGGPADPAGAGARLATGLPDIDRLVDGGFPRGRLSEIAGPASSGRTSLALALLAHATRLGEVVAAVDAADAFDPVSAEAAVAALERVLWVRPATAADATRCCERLLRAHGFALVLLDLAAGVAPPLPVATWQRLGRAAAASGTALTVLSPARVTGAFADLALEMRPARAHFSGTPPLLEGLEIEARVVRHRTSPTQRVASVRLHVASRAA